MFYYTMHSPRGANCSFVIGARDEAGGFMQNKDFIPENEVYIGVKSNNILTCLPFFNIEDMPDAEETFDIGNSIKRDKLKIHKFNEASIERELSYSSDKWSAGDLVFEIITPSSGLKNPDCDPYNEVSLSVAPIICAKFTIKNTTTELETGFFSVAGMKGLYSLSEKTGGQILGVACADGYGFAIENDDGITEVADFSVKAIFNRKQLGFYQNCAMGGICFDVPPNSERTINIVFGWFQGGIVTHGLYEMPYFYTKYFTSIENVLVYGVDNFYKLEQEFRNSENQFNLLQENELSKERKFLISQSIHSYWASTMLFNCGGRPKYIVNEGSFMMMNTFDLSIDHLFYECLTQGFVVENQLTSFVQDYSYYDTVHMTNNERNKSFTGGISFTHDQGSFATFSRKGYSSYEMKNKEGCLSYMTHEQLLNWVLCASVYVETNKDDNFLMKNKGIIADCLLSIQNRDHFDISKRDGIMDLDSDRCGTMWEITTYDSLDASLGQARRNLYLAVKTWSSYVAIYKMLSKFSGIWYQTANEALDSAKLCANTISSYFNEDLGFIPAILDGNDKTAIIPAIEALVYPYFFGGDEFLSDIGVFGDFITSLKKHFSTIFKEGLCRFDDGGYRLSSSSINSWMSKIFISEFVAEEILDIKDLDNERADKAHVKWWTVQCSRCPSIDQIMYEQEYSRGFYYPRAITSILWLMKK